MSMVTLHDVQAALGRIRDRIYLSPCARSETLSRLTGTSAHLKLENLQMTGAYKERGRASKKLLTLGEAERARGLIAASAGNHAQAVAYHAGRLGVKATIVMPETTPIMKVANTRAHGARIVLHGANYDEAYAEARRLEQAEGLTFVHPFDDPAVIAGPGDGRRWRSSSRSRSGRIVVPIGGGGLVSGVAVAAKALRPGIRVIGVETEVLPSHARGGRGGRAGHARAGEHHRRRHRGEARRGPHLRARAAARWTRSSPSRRRRSRARSSTSSSARRRSPRAPGAVAVAALMHRKIRGLEGKQVVAVVRAATST